jgi:hypothetical protein
VLDTLHFARRVPLFPVERQFDLAEVASLRSRVPARISWTVLFVKAYAIVARDHAALRRAYLLWPWPHLLEFPASVAMVTINRETHGEQRLCWGRFVDPENQPLEALQRRLDWYATAPVDEAFSRQIILSRLPAWVRRSLIWWSLNISGAKRATRVGTFSLSALAGLGALNRGHPTFLTSSLTYGPLDASGCAIVTLLCDHRVLDGVAAARALFDLQEVFGRQITRELRGLTARRRAA